MHKGNVMILSLFRSRVQSLLELFACHDVARTVLAVRAGVRARMGFEHSQSGERLEGGARRWVKRRADPGRAGTGL